MISEAIEDLAQAQSDPIRGGTDTDLNAEWTPILFFYHLVNAWTKFGLELPTPLTIESARHDLANSLKRDQADALGRFLGSRAKADNYSTISLNGHLEEIFACQLLLDYFSKVRFSIYKFS